jgi:hypothetical protein
LDLGNGQFVQWTGAELLETATSFIQFADCEKKGDREGMLARPGRDAGFTFQTPRAQPK